MSKLNNTTTFSLALLTSLNLSAVGQNSAPSSHMVFDDQFDGDLIINEVRVPEDGDSLYTYYETLGWRGKAAGYAGIQSHPRAKNFIFSIWDHRDHKAPIRAVYHGPGTETQGFGGEGTGLKSWNFKLGWSTNVWYTLVSRCWPVNDHTHFGFWVKDERSQRWTHLVTMDVASKGARFQGGTDAFIEDWLNTGQHKRTSHLRNGWKRKMDQTWFPFQSARYSVNSWDLEKGKRSYNFRTQWDGGTQNNNYFFMTSGDKSTQPSTTNPSTHKIKRIQKTPNFGIPKIDSFSAKQNKDGSLELSWQLNKKSTPQFSYQVSIRSSTQKKRQPILIQKTKPHGRRMIIPSLKSGLEAPVVELVCTDLFGKPSNPAQAKVTR
ncbi:MAG: DUF3472 domain-containing protein [Planctomycetota bacterium]|nr:DUF3472 domain-containing protein [Planctomycetota bacterium]